MKKYIVLLLAIATTAVGISCHQEQKRSTDSSDADIDSWYAQGEWLGVVRLTPDSSINKHEFYTRYHQNKALWDQAFEFLATADLASLEVGTHELAGKALFALVSEYQTKESKDGYYESHKNYTDIQYTISGEEYIDIRDTTGLTVKNPYNPEKDIIFYNEQDQHSHLAHPGVFFILFPSDIHRPGIQVNEKQPVKKIVIKVANDTSL
ncbi:YhcH/YjgK/YiaL family protein [Parapedobacter koreensis]|uniref:YhcH/YjgK/YiaL family protein n=1 Tax=Parapedobacter koreensis TaxID=332977 RepID=A0A1H7USD3_9SPHI|nr:YhcH/YjgK/YiaL family protein [Parapedobacter koreensis]SEL99706.1 YhcH/YjgK/YiaL family protein [Parapedobacter koreensis]